MVKLTKRHFSKLLFLYTILAIVSWLCFNFKLLWGPVRKRPFQCYDESLGRPYVLDTVSKQELHLLCVYMPMAIIAICELSSSLVSSRSSQCCWLQHFIMKYGVSLNCFLIGFALERLIKNIAKIKMARLRPNFLLVCDPVNSDGNRCHNMDDSIIMDQYECSSKIYPSWDVIGSFLSFPSGHASLSAYGMVFMVCYLQLKYSNAAPNLLLLLLQVCCSLISFFVGVSRVLDYKHHWSDIFGGYILGSSVALATSWCMKSEWSSMDIWLKDVVMHTPGKQNQKASLVNGHVTEEKDSCTLDMGSHQ